MHDVKSGSKRKGTGRNGKETWKWVWVCGMPSHSPTTPTPQPVGNPPPLLSHSTPHYNNHLLVERKQKSEPKPSPLQPPLPPPPTIQSPHARSHLHLPHLPPNLLHPPQPPLSKTLPTATLPSPVNSLPLKYFFKQSKSTQQSKRTALLHHRNPSPENRKLVLKKLSRSICHRWHSNALSVFQFPADEYKLLGGGGESRDIREMTHWEGGYRQA
jgi:hypothetical protein